MHGDIPQHIAAQLTPGEAVLASPIFAATKQKFMANGTLADLSIGARTSSAQHRLTQNAFAACCRIKFANFSVVMSPRADLILDRKVPHRTPAVDALVDARQPLF